MLCLPDYNKPYDISGLTDPVIIKHNWIFHAPSVDFMLNPITYLEETTGVAIKLRINNFDFWVPASWYILAVCPETYIIDTVSISTCASVQYQAFSFSPDEMKLRLLEIRVVGYEENVSLVHPMINKQTALVHPVGISHETYGKQHMLSVAIGPHDLNKLLESKVIGDVFGY
jgi:hypothetical protein